MNWGVGLADDGLTPRRVWKASQLLFLLLAMAQLLSISFTVPSVPSCTNPHVSKDLKSSGAWHLPQCPLNSLPCSTQKAVASQECSVCRNSAALWSERCSVAAND